MSGIAETYKPSHLPGKLRYFFRLMVYLASFILVASITSAFPAEPTFNWTHLPDSVKADVLERFHPVDILKLSLTSKTEKEFTQSYLDSIWDASEEAKLGFFMEAAATNNTALFQAALKNGYTFPDEKVFQTACAEGNIQVAKAFLGTNPKAKLQFRDMRKVRSNCLELASSKGFFGFVKETGVATNVTAQALRNSITNALKGKQEERANYLFSIQEQDPRSQQLFQFMSASCLGNAPAMEQIMSRNDSQVTLNDIVTMSQFAPLAEYFNRQNDFASAPVPCAIRHGHLESIRFLVSLRDKGAPIVFKSGQANQAIRSGNVKLVNYLIQVSSTPFVLQEDSLILASFSGSSEMLEWVIQESKRQQIVFGMDTIRHAKISARNRQTLETLLSVFGGQVSLTGFEKASEMNEKDLFRYYLGIIVQDDLLRIPREFTTRILHNIIEKRWADVLKDFIDKWGLENIRKLSYEVRHAATQLGNVEILKMFFNSPDLLSFMDYRALSFAVASGKQEALQYLIDRVPEDVDLSQPLNKAFIGASYLGHIGMMDYILSLDSKYQSINPASFGNQALINALVNDQITAARKLISLMDRFPDISPSARDNFAFKFARKKEDYHIVDFLLSLPDHMGIDHSLTSADPESFEGVSGDLVWYP